MAARRDGDGGLRDRRQPGKVQHDVLELSGSACSGSCAATPIATTPRLAHDPLHKLLVDRDPLAGPALASQTTLSRFENAVGPLALTRLGHALADLVIEQQRLRRQGRARRITIDSIHGRSRPGSKSSPSSTATTTPGATCRSWGS